MEASPDEMLKELEALPPTPPRARWEPKKIRYIYEAIIDFVIANPQYTQREIAAKFERSEGWICMLMSTDTFKKRLYERREEIVDPVLTASVEETFEGVARLSARIVAEKLEQTRNSLLAIQAMAITARAVGYGARNAQPAVQNQVVVVVPSKSSSSDEWAKTYATPALPHP